MTNAALTAGERLGRLGQARNRRGKGEKRIDHVIIIGASAGGHGALGEIFRSLPAELPAAIVVLIHMPEQAGMSFNRVMERMSRLPIVEVMDKEELRQGAIFVPAPGRSATLARGTIVVDSDVRARPLRTISRTFESAARVYGRRVTGVILSGLLRDGTDGLRAVHKAGGITMVQDPEGAEYPDMPRNAMEHLPVTFCLNVAEIGPALELLVRRTAQFETGLAVAVRTLRARAALLLRLEEQSKRNPGTREFLRHERELLRRDLESVNDLVIGS